MSKFRVAVLGLISLTVLSALAHSEDISVLFLPTHVEAKADEISLYADYGAVDTSGRVPVYLVNRSNQPIELNAQDGDIYLKLEYRDESGRWIRAQPHFYSWCGNSYLFKPTVNPGHYIITSGYQPINGESRTIRYRLHEQDIEITSNTGQGVVTEQDIDRASHDAMAIKQGDFNFVSEFALSVTPIKSDFDTYGDQRIHAILALGSGRFDSEEAMEVLLTAKDNSPELEEIVERAIRQLEAQARRK